MFVPSASDSQDSMCKTSHGDSGLEYYNICLPEHLLCAGNCTYGSEPQQRTDEKSLSSGILHSNERKQIINMNINNILEKQRAASST